MSSTTVGRRSSRSRSSRTESSSTCSPPGRSNRRGSEPTLRGGWADNGSPALCIVRGIAGFPAPPAHRPVPCPERETGETPRSDRAGRRSPLDPRRRHRAVRRRRQLADPPVDPSGHGGLALAGHLWRRAGKRLRPHRARVHAGLRRPAHDQLRPRRRVHVRGHDLLLRGRRTRPGRLPELEPDHRLRPRPPRRHHELDDRRGPARADRVSTAPARPPSRPAHHRDRRIAVHQQQRPGPVRRAGQGLAADRCPRGHDQYHRHSRSSRPRRW